MEPPINESSRVHYHVEQHDDTVTLWMAKPGKKAKPYVLSPGQASRLSGELLSAGVAGAMRKKD